LIVPTGLDDFAIVQVSNVITSDRINGFDDYTDVDSIIGDMMVRIGQIDRILDKHANPSMSGPSSALERDEVTGTYRLKTGNYFPRDNSDDPKVEYITWEGQLDASFRQIEKLTNMLYTISEMGSALLGDTSNTVGQVASGTSLKRLMISPLAKVGRVRGRFDSALKKAIRLCSQLGGKRIEKGKISIGWKDGLPEDDMEVANILEKRMAGNPSMSAYRALQKYDQLTPEQAEEELGYIEEENATPLAMPVSATTPESEETTESEQTPREGE